MGSSGSTLEDVRRVFGELGYQLEEKIEDGSRHNVYLAYSGKLGKQVRIAEYSVKDKNHKQRLNWQRLKHHNVLRLHEFFVFKKRAYFVHENLPKNPVSSYFDLHPSPATGPGRGRESLSRRWTQQSLSVLVHCKKMDLYLHDFNFEDVWVDQNMNAKIACFDRLYPGAYRRSKIDWKTVNYRSPEGLTKSGTLQRWMYTYRRQQHSAEKAMVWALGASLFQLLTSCSIVGQDFRLSDDARKVKTKKRLIKSNTAKLLGYLETTDLSEEAKDFLKQTLSYNASNRPTIEEALKHPWFSVVDYQSPVVIAPTDGMDAPNKLTGQPRLTTAQSASCPALVVRQEVIVDQSKGHVRRSASAVDMEYSKDTLTPVDMKYLKSALTPVDMKCSKGALTPVDMKYSKGDVTPVDMKYSKGALTPVDMKHSKDALTPVDMEPSMGDLTPVDMEHSKDALTPVDMESSKETLTPVDMDYSMADLTTVDMVEESSKDTIDTLPSECKLPIESEPIKLIEKNTRELLAITEGALKRIGSPDPVVIPIKPFVFTEMDDPPTFPEYPSNFSDMEVMLERTENGVTPTGIGSPSLSVENEVRSAEDLSLERLLESAANMMTTRSDPGQASASGDEGTQTYLTREPLQERLLNTGMDVHAEGQEEELVSLLNDQTPFPTYGRFVPSLTTIPEDKELQVYRNRRQSQAGDSGLSLNATNKVAIAILTIIVITLVGYEIYLNVFKETPPS